MDQDIFKSDNKNNELFDLSQNVTFTGTSFLKAVDFEETLAFVKGLTSTWNTSQVYSKTKVSKKPFTQSLKISQNVNDGTQLEKIIKTTQSKPDENYKTCLQHWGLPSEIINKYLMKGVRNMFDWQVECLGNPKVLHENGNLVYSAPTSAGKTLVAEIITIKTVLERQKKVIIILPFVSVVREKMFYFQDIFSDSGIRVEGFMGSHTPPGGVQSIHIAICTIEKANSLVNRLLEDGSISELGTVVVDEMHLLGDSHRGYILELLLTKLLYVTKKYDDVNIQIIGMSATLPNLSLLSNWLGADLYKTDFRPIPLEEVCHIMGKIYNSQMEVVKSLEPSVDLMNDKDNIVKLCLETIADGCSVLIFCPTKNWCENLAQQIASTFKSLGYSKSIHGNSLRCQIDGSALGEVLEQLKSSPVGLDVILHSTISFGVAYHHAGLTMDERDIIEGAFKRNAIRVLIATSTLSSGVNLPARRVIIRTPIFHMKPINILTYKQMVGRAGRMGIDIAGESILMCSVNEKKIAMDLISGTFNPISSCLEGGDKLMRAVLEVIASEVAKTPDDVRLFITCTLLFHSLEMKESVTKYCEDSIKNLLNYELIRLQNNGDETFYIATPLGKACLSSSMTPQDGLTLFKELQKARECFVLESDLHMIYLVTPYSICAQWGELNWLHLLSLWDGLSVAMKRVGGLIGIDESFIYRCMRGSVKMNLPSIQNKLQSTRRFYTALALQDLVNEVPLSVVASNFNCSRGMLQSLQQSAATFAGMVTAFSRELGWKSFEILVTQFQDRLQFGIQSDLLDLMRLQSLNGSRARALFNANIESVCELASADVLAVENALLSTVPFQSEKEREGEIKYDVDKRNNLKCVWITGRKGVTTKEAAELLVYEARRHLQMEIGIADVKWKSDKCDVQDITQRDNSLSISPTQSCSFNTHNIKSPLGIIDDTEYNKKTLQPSSMCLLDGKIISPKHSTPKNDIDLIKKKYESITCATNDTGLNFSQQSLLSSFDYKKMEVSFANAQPRLESIISSDDLSVKVECPQSSGEVQKKTTHSELFNDGFKTIEFDSELFDVSKKSNSMFQSDLSKSLSLFEDSFTVDTQLCEKLDKKQLTLEQIPASTTYTDNKHCNSETSAFPPCEGLSCIEAAFDSSFTNSLKPSFKNISNEIIDCSPESKNIIESSQEYSAFKSLSMKRIPKKILKKKKIFKSNITNNQKRKFTDTKNENKTVDISNLSPLKQRRVENYQFGNANIKSDNNFSLPQCMRTDNLKLIDLASRSLPDRSNKWTNEIGNFQVLKVVNVCKNMDAFTESTSLLLKQNKFSIHLHLIHRYSNQQNKIGMNAIKLDNMKIDKNINEYRGKIVHGLSVYNGHEYVYYFDFKMDDNLESSTDKVLKFLKSFLSMKNKKFLLYNCKQSYIFLKKCCNLEIKTTWEDPLVAGWLVDPESDCKSLETMALDYCYCDINVSTDTTEDICFAACLGAWATWYAMDHFKGCLAKKNDMMLKTLSAEMDAIKVLAECEICGIGVDKEMSGKVLNQVRSMQNILESNAFKLTGRRFRMTSPSEVAKVLGMHKGRKTSTNKKALEKIENPLAQLIIYWRKLNSILTKNLFPLTAQAVKNGSSQRIYGSYWTHTSTGRMTMQDPNLQSVPRTFEIPSELLGCHSDDKVSSVFCCRNIFPSASGTLLVSADYCQLELRILAHLSNDSTLRKIVIGKGDIFKAIASTWKCIPEVEVDDDLRQKAKQICYGIIYGMGNKALSQTLDICELEATVFINTFHAAYPSIKLYINSVIQKCKSLGYIETLSGRRRYLPSITAANISEKAHAERQAVNTTIQGSAADILKSAMTLIQQKLEDDLKNMNDVNLVLLLHDELMYEVPVEKVDQFTTILRNCMETTVSLSVPLPVKIKVGKLWGDLKEIPLKNNL